MPLEEFSFVWSLGLVKSLLTFGIIYATDPFLQNLTKIICHHAELRALIFHN